MRLRRLAVIAAAAAALAIPAVAAAIPAQAAPTTEICGLGGGLCANDQGNGGSGAHVIGWPRGAQNNNFHQVTLTGMCGNGGLVTHTCPFTVGSGLNDEFFGSIISKIQYLNNTGLCVATNTSNGHATMGACPDNNGNGGANGTILIDYHTNSSCNGTDRGFFESRYWSDFFGTASSMENPVSQSSDLFFGSTGTETCYQQVSP